jgi:hypothetical protein
MSNNWDVETLKTAGSVAAVTISLWSLWISHRTRVDTLKALFDECKKSIAMQMVQNDARKDHLKLRAQLRHDEFERLIQRYPRLDSDDVREVMAELKGILGFTEEYESTQSAYSPEDIRRASYSRASAKSFQEVLHHCQVAGARLDQDAWKFFANRAAERLAELKQKAASLGNA